MIDPFSMLDTYHERALEIGFVTIVVYLVTMFSCAVVNPTHHTTLNAFSVLLGFTLRGLAMVPLCSYLEDNESNRHGFVYTELVILAINLYSRFEAL
jgi:FtsH-binding integral membrane protein